MWRTPVVSSAIASIGYDEERKMLEVEFNSGSVYRYFDVPPDTHLEFITAPSHGRYFDQYVRDVFDFEQVQ
jgi:hypothetical protein